MLTAPILDRIIVRQVTNEDAVIAGSMAKPITF
jgi:hypothetical protein